jgi:hypothetical protein
MVCEGYPFSIPIGKDEFGNDRYWCIDWWLILLVAGVLIIPPLIGPYVLWGEFKNPVK